MRVNSEGGIKGELVKHAEVLAAVAEVRERGYAMTNGIATPDAGMLAMSLPSHLAEEIGQPAAIGIGTAATLLIERRDELLAIFREELAAAS